MVQSLQEGVVIDNTPQTQQFDPNRRSFSETVEIAQNSIRMLEEDMVETRGVSPARRLNLESGVKAFRQVSTRSDLPTSNSDTLLYVFNFDDNQGFAVAAHCWPTRWPSGWASVRNGRCLRRCGTERTYTVISTRHSIKRSHWNSRMS